MDQFVKSSLRTQPKHQARKTIALSAFFLIAMALLMSIGKTDYQGVNEINYPNNFAQASSDIGLS
jgi:hypothetical protein